MLAAAALRCSGDPLIDPTISRRVAGILAHLGVCCGRGCCTLQRSALRRNAGGAACVTARAGASASRRNRLCPRVVSTGRLAKMMRKDHVDCCAVLMAAATGTPAFQSRTRCGHVADVCVCVCMRARPLPLRRFHVAGAGVQGGNHGLLQNPVSARLWEHRAPFVLEKAAVGPECFDCEFYLQSFARGGRWTCWSAFTHFVNHGQFEMRPHRCASRRSRPCIAHGHDAYTFESSEGPVVGGVNVLVDTAMYRTCTHTYIHTYVRTHALFVATCISRCHMPHAEGPRCRQCSGSTTTTYRLLVDLPSRAPSPQVATTPTRESTV